MKVEELDMYGKALEMPEEILKKQKKVVFFLLRREFGIIGFVGMMLSINKHSKRIVRQYPKVINRAKGMSNVLAEELIMMGALFSSVADHRGKKIAKEFMTKMIKNIAPVSIPVLYQLNDLVKCDGDVFDNFKKFNRALFTKTDSIGIWKNNGICETDDLLELKVISCVNIELFKAIDCPELITLGCDHDLAGYSLIEEAVQCDFRRTCTLAKGGNCCHFQFYRKGTAPNNSNNNK